ncbi:hypothetical protein LH51_16650 [Nitrincola sp. A-D6]|nr:hypothetical protein LH51_16650 [Nitrincola sp. A-D6]
MNLNDWLYYKATTPTSPKPWLYRARYPENRWKQLREQQGQHSKNDDTGDEITTTEKAIPIDGQLYV